MSAKGIKVTTEDLETGESKSAEVMDGFVLVCAGTCHVESFVAHGNGTVQVVIKGRRKGL